ncbi:MAG: hypothetical protein V7695_23815 [Sulfitobacter sp.]
MLYNRKPILPRSLLNIVLTLALVVLSIQNVRSDEHTLESYCLGNAWESCFIYFDGTITSGLGDQFKEILESEGPAVYLNSPGGDLEEALKIGRLIRKSGKSTIIGSLDGVQRSDFLSRPESMPTEGICESACAYIFMGGAERDLGSGKLGLHRFFSTERGLTSDEAQFLSGLLVEYMVEMGVDARLFLAASKEGAASMYYISDNEALDYDVITPTGYGDFFLEPYLGGVVAATRRLDPTTPYSSVNQVTFFCEQGRPHVMLTAQSGFIEDSAKPYPRFEIAEAGLKTISNDFLTVRDIGDISLLTIEIPTNIQSGMFTLRKNVRQFYVDVPFSRAAGGVYGARLEMSEMDTAMVNSALRHYIR